MILNPFQEVNQLFGKSPGPLIMNVMVSILRNEVSDQLRVLCLELAVFDLKWEEVTFRDRVEHEHERTEVAIDNSRLYGGHGSPEKGGIGRSST